MTAASHRGSELDRSRKKKLIPMYRAAAKKYRPLIGRHSLITCEDGLVIDILWEKRNFEHLCGVWCDRPPQVVHAGKTIEANYFFDQLIKGRLPSSAIHYSDYPRTRGKAEVLSNALDLEGNVDVVVDSDKAEVVYYLGGEAWCLGLDSDWNGNRMRSGLCNGNVFYPKSIRRQSVYKRMRTDSTPIAFQRWNWSAPESLPTYARSLGSDRIRGARGVGHERPIRHPPSRPSASDNRSSLTLTYKRRTVMA